MRPQLYLILTFSLLMAGCQAEQAKSLTARTPVEKLGGPYEVRLYLDAQGNDCAGTPNEEIVAYQGSQTYFVDTAGGDFSPARLEKVNDQWKLYIRRMAGESCAGVHIFYMTVGDPDLNSPDDHLGPEGIYTSGLKLATVFYSGSLREPAKGDDPPKNAFPKVRVEVNGRGRDIATDAMVDTSGRTPGAYRYIAHNPGQPFVVVQPAYDGTTLKEWECIVVRPTKRNGTGDRGDLFDRHLIAKKAVKMGEDPHKACLGDYTVRGEKITVKVTQ